MVLKKPSYFVVSFILLFGLLFPFSTSTSAAGTASVQKNKNNVEMTSEQYDNLLNLGFTEKQIANMDQEEFARNKDLKGKVVATSKHYLKITEDSKGNSIVKNLDKKTYDTEVAIEKEKIKKERASSKRAKTISLTPTSFATAALANIPNDDSSTSYKTMTTLIIKFSSRQFRVRNHIDWHIMPAIRGTDVSGVTLNSQWLQNPGTQYARQDWTTFDNCSLEKTASAVYTKSSDKWNPGLHGYALRMNLPNDKMVYCGGYSSPQVVDDLSSYMYYDISPVTAATPARADAIGQYFHLKIDLNPSITIGWKTLEFSVSPSYAYSEHIPRTQAVIYNK
ncbi:hypothetical protein [Neobacillus sp. CF12]|uniref:hypothetical protein n=1 Tax=Neobacillus sp. CF12 TaxID=3055864 RepID=UPI0025A1BB25|nr:hypothetical protein [Neobacillus sp. CF12]MDM5330345.1 hypothetical protein [Neobacillus sp. CF12]